MTRDDPSAELLAVCDDLRAALVRRRPAEVLGVGAAVESAVVIRGRFVDSGPVGVTSTLRTGGCVRSHTADGFRQVASTSPSPQLVGDLFGGAAQAGRVRPMQVVGDATDLAGLMGLLSAVDDAARSVDDRITQVLIDFETTDQMICVDGVLDRRRTTYLSIRTVARDRGEIVTGTATPGVAGAWSALDPVGIGVEAARRAVAKFGARPAPVGHLPVVVSGGRGIVLIHEACCHALEADEVLRGSTYSGRMAQMIAASGVTIVDDPTATGLVGGYGVDDEGEAARPTTLVADGRLAGYLTTRQSARQLGVERTPNARCETVMDAPLPRMSNTCLAAGTDAPESVIGDIALGVYAEHVGGGEVVESTGSFVFRVSNGRMIRDGVLAEPIQETTLAGSGPAVLTQIYAVGDDVTTGAARCGKNGQAVLVGLSGPTIAVRSLLVGGTGA